VAPCQRKARLRTFVTGHECAAGWRYTVRDMERRRLRGLAPSAILAGVALYVALLCVSPLFHHDLDCHLKSPSHCGACVANPLAPRIESGFGLGTTALDWAGSVEGARPEHIATPALDHSSGRSPPA